MNVHYQLAINFSSKNSNKLVYQQIQLSNISLEWIVYKFWRTMYREKPDITLILKVLSSLVLVDMFKTEL